MAPAGNPFLAVDVRTNIDEPAADYKAGNNGDPLHQGAVHFIDKAITAISISVINYSTVSGFH